MTKRHLIRLDHDLFIKLQKLAEADSRSVTKLIEIILKEYIK